MAEFSSTPAPPASSPPPTPRLSELVRAALARDAGRQALEYDRRWYSWGEFRALADQLTGLLAGSGAGARQPVAFIARNRPSSVAALLGLIADQRTIQMVYPFQSAAALAANLERLAPAAVVASPGLIGGTVAETLAARGLAAIEIDEMEARIAHGLAASSRSSDEGAPPAPEIQILTSGTTGPPKQIAFSYEFFANHHVLPALQHASSIDYAQEPPLLLTFPLGNITGMYSTLPTLMRGQRAILVDRFTLEAWHDWVKRFKPANAGLPPAGLQMILDADIPAEDLASVQFIGSGAAPLDPSVHRRFLERYGVPILLSYGATEFGGPVTAMTLDLHRAWGEKKFGSVGRAMPGVKLRIVDPESGAELPPGAEGVLEVVSPRIGPHWIRTSDIAILDADGFLFHRGRADGAVMRGGFKLTPEVIERALLTHPAIADAAVVGRKDRRLGEAPVAAIVLRPGAAWPGDEALEAFVRQHLPATHVPVAWRRLDALPRNPSMKLDRPRLREIISSD